MTLSNDGFASRQWAEISDEAKAIDELAPLVKSNRGVYSDRGPHTDNTGDAAYNSLVRSARWPCANIAKTLRRLEAG